MRQLDSSLGRSISRCAQERRSGIKNLVLTMPIRFWLVILVIVVAIAWALTKMH
jgi:hypothetical protein